MLKMSKSKMCYTCRKVKSLTDFYKSKGRQKYDGRHVVCILCSRTAATAYQMKHKERQRKNARERVRRMKEEENPRFYVRKKLGSTRDLAKKYGRAPCITPFPEVLKRFTLICEVCMTKVGVSICLDHCHKTGKFRGFLCNNCNTALGYARDDIEILKGLIKYLRKK